MNYSKSTVWLIMISCFIMSVISCVTHAGHVVFFLTVSNFIGWAFFFLTDREVRKELQENRKCIAVLREQVYAFQRAIPKGEKRRNEK